MDKKDFCHSMYTVKMKRSEDLLAVPPPYQILDATLGFDNDKEILDSDGDAQVDIVFCLPNFELMETFA
jgi:hypothetical protein